MKTIATFLLALASLASAFNFPVLKPANLPLYDEAISMAYASVLVYDIATITKEARKQKVALQIPADYPLDEQGLARFADENIDFRGLNGDDGLSFSQITNFLAANNKDLIDTDKIMVDDFEQDVIGLLSKANNQAKDNNERIYLECFESLSRKFSCVYGIVKDKARKQIIIIFRGSTAVGSFEGRDWITNANVRLADLRTPKLIQDKMDGRLKKRVLVHEGYYNYLFDNKRLDGDQQFDKIEKTIKELLTGEKGYSVHVTGHSLGGALASLFAFKLAGRNVDWLPRPVTCISYASPRFGTSSVRTAHEQLEKEGLLRHLRINTAEDIVPTMLAASHFTVPSRRKMLKHVGLNLRLKKSGYDLIHTSKLTGFSTRLNNMLKNTILKPVWKFMTNHMMPLHVKRMNKNKAELSKVTLDGLYKDDNIVGKDFKVVSVESK
mmetsp:Transcript_19264/g.28504  ORF Transcript_19264/g.28504 Transcript_19264/m.28504 type:complete len:438 (+) Transcript_19264:60-1373(+)